MKYTPLLLVLALLLTCGCMTKDGRTGRSTLGFGIPGVGTIEGSNTTPPGKDVGSSLFIEKLEVTGLAAEILSARLGGGIVELQNLKEKTENPDTPPE